MPTRSATPSSTPRRTISAGCARSPLARTWTLPAHGTTSSTRTCSPSRRTTRPSIRNTQMSSSNQAVRHFPAASTTTWPTTSAATPRTSFAFTEAGETSGRRVPKIPATAGHRWRRRRRRRRWGIRPPATKVIALRNSRATITRPRAARTSARWRSSARATTTRACPASPSAPTGWTPTTSPRSTSPSTPSASAAPSWRLSKIRASTCTRAPCCKARARARGASCTRTRPRRTTTSSGGGPTPCRRASTCSTARTWTRATRASPRS